MKTDLNVYMDASHHIIVHKICFGCVYFKSNESVRDICSIMSLYMFVKSNEMTFRSFLERVKSCPCNQKCLVKATCTEVCPEWQEYVSKGDNMSTFLEIKIDIIRRRLKKMRKSNGSS